jgi:hypothetical protein
MESATGMRGRGFDQVAWAEAQMQWPVITTPARNGLIPSRLEPRVKKPGKASKTIRANKRKAKLRAKHRRQRARAAS